MLALRLMLPLVFAPLLAARLSRALGTRVEIGDLTLQPIDAILSLRDVTVHARAGTTGSPDPPIVAARVRVDLQWLPLLHHTLRVRELALESARIDVDRFADGRFGLANLERPDPARELPADWSFVLDRVALRSAQLRVRDLADGGAALIDVTLRSAEISGLQRRPTAFGKATNLRVDGLIGGGRLRARGRYDMRDDGLALDVLAWMKGIGVASARPYVATLGWSELAGRVSGRLRWQREPQRRDLLNGRVVLRRGSVRVDGLDQAALTLRRGVADVTAIDLLTRRIAISSLRLSGATLALRPDFAAPVPLITPAFAHAIATRDASAPKSRWSWMVDRLSTADGRLRLHTGEGSFDLRAQVSGESLGPDAYWSPLRIEATRNPLAVTFDGVARLADGWTIEGRLAAAGIELPGMVRAAGLPWADLVQAGHAAADLTVQLDATPGEEPPFDARGGITVTDLWLAGPDPGAFAFGTPNIQLTLDGSSRPKPRRGDQRDGGAPRIIFSAAEVTAPYLLLTRTPDGWILPPFTPADATPLATTAPATEGPDIFFAKVSSGDGRVTLVDMAPSPAVTWDLTSVGVSASNVSLAQLTFDGAQLAGRDSQFGPLQLGITRQGGIHHFEATGENVPLAATAPYFDRAGLPYRFSLGRGSFTARGARDGSRWNADAELTLRGPVLAGSAAALERDLGMSIPTALALLRDEHGDVALQIALASTRADAQDGYATQIASGIRDAIRRSGDVPQVTASQASPSLPNITVSFAAGQAELSSTAMAEIASVAALLRSRPGLTVELDAATSADDRRWLAEQSLRHDIADNGGFRTFLRAIGMRDARDRIGTALAARARGAPGYLDRQDEALLAQLVAQAPPVEDSQLGDLRTARLTRVMAHLVERHGITGRRVVIHDGAPSNPTVHAAVRLRVALGPDDAPAAPEALPLVNRAPPPAGRD